jgi:cytochrome c peroxidase
MNSEKVRVLIFSLFFVALLLFAILYQPINAVSGTPDQRTAVMPAGRPLLMKAPLGLPPVPIPADNPPTLATVALGRLLYYDPVLSGDNSVSCASCHGLQMGFADSRPLSIGVGGKTGTRHSPTVINSAYSSLQFWDGRAPSLEEQAKGPIENPVEMATTHAEVVQRLQADPKYVALFKQAWGTDQVTIDLVVKSIASFERTVLSGNSPFDRFIMDMTRKRCPPRLSGD